MNATDIRIGTSGMVYPRQFHLTPTGVADFWNWSISVSDPRVADWPFMSSPWLCWSLCIAYLIMVPVGLRAMQHRRPMDWMKPLIIVYNVGMVALSLVMGCGLLYHGYIKAKYPLVCAPVAFHTASDNDVHHDAVAFYLYLYFISKLIEFLDTFFMVVRKKTAQVTFLHLYHHSFMFFIWWFGIKWAAGGDSAFGAMINCFIHVTMYAYYALAAAFPNASAPTRSASSAPLPPASPASPFADPRKKSPVASGDEGAASGTPTRGFMNRWVGRYLRAVKPRITQMQLTQFLVVLVHSVTGIVYTCDFPQWMYWSLLLYMISLIILFMNFYIRTYVLRQRARKTA
eukprot:TRINITY_DN1749_c0_g1_i1.p1 TRINITY_DN1749_c0_g1~~TRINITY_DN1749_c0_g1_i1.p1  ORF type:complete len:343 (+),score=56.36 TRINITY_DN1749_c0_g1_i1:145-1173(+)